MSFSLIVVLSLPFSFRLLPYTCPLFIHQIFNEHICVSDTILGAVGRAMNKIDGSPSLRGVYVSVGEM